MTSPDTTPVWKDPDTFPRYPTLGQDLKVDVLIIGGGITGVSCAHLLAKSGLQVALVESHRLGSGDSSHTTAHLTYMTDTRMREIVRTCGKQEAKIAWQAGHAAMEHIRATCADCGADTGFEEVDGYLAAAADGDDKDERSALSEDLGLIRELGFEAEWVEAAPPTGKPAIRFPGQMKFHPLRYIHAIAKQAAAHGVSIFEQTNVDEFHASPDHVVAGGHKIHFGRVIIATHVPLQGNKSTITAALFQTKLASYSTYAIAVLYPKDTLPRMIWSDTAEPFNYLRIDGTDEGDLAIFGGEDHKTGQETDTAACYARLEERLERYLGKGTVTHRWSGQVVETVDGLPYIGEIMENQFIATGFSGNGFTFGVATALMAKDWVEGVDNPCFKTFSPSRVHLGATGTYLNENKDFPIRMVKDRLGLGKKEREDDLRAGEGCVLRIDGKPVAVCRDSKGGVHHLSAVCPHMGCIVAWNPVEETWDCPCHGSRFTSKGGVIAGPAETDLEPVG